ncbi:MAG: putative toxin-antitoxin system toxin component, PIN family [Oscillatoria princeps RMCB-10]|jgi:putative PIN family toxin of toxin-antitoxin system|nr:putative toxin-antitoxin system toxin component, PIN family [Oscillatoria princeps RMCB-10]
MTAPTVVFGTNILISAVLSLAGKPFQCTALAKRGLVKSVTCQEILNEFQEKLTVKFEYEPQRAQAFVQEVLDYSELVTLTNTLRVVDADPDDDMVLECAVVGDASYIITGDRHLLTLVSYHGISILKAADFLALLFQG